MLPERIGLLRNTCSQCDGSPASALTCSTRSTRRSGFLSGKGLHSWCGVRYKSSQIRGALLDCLRITLGGGRQLRIRLIRAFEVKCARQISNCRAAPSAQVRNFRAEASFEESQYRRMVEEI